MVASKHEYDCDCAACNGTDMDKWHKEMMEEHGWYCHFITGTDPQSPTGVNFHTHGIETTFKSPDLQIVIPMEARVANQIFADAVNAIKANGKAFQHGDRSSRVIGNNFDVIFAKTTESGRDVLRIILPDAAGNLAESEQDEYFQKQWTGTEGK